MRKPNKREKPKDEAPKGKRPKAERRDIFLSRPTRTPKANDQPDLEARVLKLEQDIEAMKSEMAKLLKPPKTRR